MNTKDLGTYHVRVVLEDGRGFILEWGTGRRYTNETDGVFPLNAMAITPPFENEEQVLSSILYIFTDGNYSCDCNKLNFIERAYRQPETEDPPCGDSLKLSTLTVITPDGREIKLL